VEFEIEQTPRGPQAVSVVVLERASSQSRPPTHE
jgi:hypothetical protein